jgi:tRNA nucleotidyltransferase (CCA-adding enzyme)
MDREAEELLDIFAKHGFESYKVGGYVRDKLRGEPIQDIDIATSATPDQVIRLFANSIPTGIDHGTVSIPYKGHLFEVTTFRVEKDYRDHRHPSRIEFVSQIELDLGRRDFTINAMAMDSKGNIIDPYGGQEDLRQGIIRAVGVASERFREDALRILRGIRFASKLRFSIEPGTWRAVQECGILLSHISKERIRDEWRKTIESNHSLYGVALLDQLGNLPFAEWRKIFHATAIKACDHLVSEQDEPAYRWALLLACDHITDAAPLLSQWKFPKKLIHEVQEYLDLVFMPTQNELEVKRRLVTSSLSQVLEAFRIRNSLELVVNFNEAVISRWDDEISIRKMTELAIVGSDLLQALDKKPGPWVGRILNLLFEQVAFHGMPNDRDYLLTEARKVYDNERENT